MMGYVDSYHLRLCFFLCFTFVTAQNPTVKLKSGAMMMGKRITLNKGDNDLVSVDQYLGIRYAEAPLGDSRFRMVSVQDPKWSGTQNYTAFGAACMQPVRTTSTNMPAWTRQDILTMQTYVQTRSEDCLFLNIYSPVSRDTNQPMQNRTVMVFIHGGWWSSGTGAMYDGTVLASYGKVIVVTFNYRLGVFGFLSTGDGSAMGNAGLWDQVRALEWIQKYIKYFGGNPNNVVIFGSGSGAACVNLLMTSPEVKAKALFSRGISQSGTAMATWSISRSGRQYAQTVAKAAGCDVSNNTGTMVECLRVINENTLANITRYDPEKSPYYRAFSPVVDGILVLDDPKKLRDSLPFTTYDYMVGVAESDGFMYVEGIDGIYDGIDRNRFESVVRSFVQDVFQTRLQEIIDAVTFSYTDWGDRNNDLKRRKSTVALFTDFFFVVPAIKTVNSHSRNSPTKKTFFYTFQHQSENTSVPDWTGAIHGEELPFVFGAPIANTQLLSPDGLYSFTSYSKQEAMLSVAIMTYWTNFAKTGNPNTPQAQETAFLHQKTNRFEGLKWRRYQRGSHYFAIGMKPKDDRSHYRAAKVAFWMEWLPRISEPRNSTSGIPGGDSSLFGPFSCPTEDSVDSRDEWKPRKVPYDIPSFRKNKPTKKPHSRELSITISVGITLLVINIVVFSMCYYRRDKRKPSAEDKHTMTLLNGRNSSPPAVEVVEVGSTDEACLTSDTVPSGLCDTVPSGLCDTVPSGLCDTVPSGMCNTVPSGLCDTVPSGLCDTVPSGLCDTVPSGLCDTVPSGLCDTVPSGLCDTVPSGLCDTVPSGLSDSLVSRRSQDSGIKSPINSTDSIDIDTPRKNSLYLEN
ncbi:neuroligin-4, X-linked-like isoform X1 [Branchiostoma lanceolatum]|uniref:neuroligin-4, X-linked-like isoform X1 n=1 Tax=Branchiostoma lanceolatum TaxID=7740 RepID=UPI003454699D